MKGWVWVHTWNEEVEGNSSIRKADFWVRRRISSEVEQWSGARPEGIKDNQYG